MKVHRFVRRTAPWILVIAGTAFSNSGSRAEEKGPTNT